MLTSRDLMALEDHYRSLRESLFRLTDILLHSSDEAEQLDCFRVSKEIAVNFFGSEEIAMEQCGCPAHPANRTGHQRFLYELAELESEFRQIENGIPVAIKLRRDLLSWLYEHHRVVDHQMVNHLQKLGRAGETTAMVRVAV